MNLVGMMDSAQVALPANNNNDVPARVSSMVGMDFDNLYNNNPDFRTFIKLVQMEAEMYGGVFAAIITPGSSPERPGKGGGPRNSNSGAAGVAAN